MKRKKNKFAFGIFQDGLTIKIAELALIDDAIKILRLEKTELSAPLYQKFTDGLPEDLAAIEEVKEEEDFDELKKLDQLEDLSISGDLGDESLDIIEGEDIDKTETAFALEKEKADSGKKEFQRLLQSFPFEKGKIALNANDEQISYHQFDSAFATSKLRKKLKAEILSKEELKSRNYTLDYIINPNGSGLAFVHRGPFELFATIQELNPIITKEKYIYSYIDTNEISLMNLVRTSSYDFPPEDFVTILYIGIDYKVGIVMKDKNHIKTFPIIITETEPEKKRQAIYSKIILEQDISNTPITQHVILAGEDVSDEDVAFYQEKGFYWDPLKRLELKDIEFIETEEEISSAEKIAQYAIPIALAWKTLTPKNKNFFPSNLLPSSIIESQKYFKIAWHGFLILAAIFYFTLSGTLKNLELKQEIIRIKSRTTFVQTELQEVKRKIAVVNKMKSNIKVIEDKTQLVKELTGVKNLWYYIIKTFSNSFRTKKLSWIEELRTGENIFKISASTTRRRNIIAYSSLFPNSKLANISPIFIEEIPIWNFDMEFSYPDPKEVSEKEYYQIIAEKTPSTKTQPKDINQAVEDEITEDEITLLYRNIINIYFPGNIDEAFIQFNEFIKKYPNHKRVYNANYFIGECLYLKGKIPEAKAIFENILQQEGNKIPDALLMTGNCYEKENNIERALFYWNKLLSSYPEHNLASFAQYKINTY
jgi:TolA-binding protein